ncbi:serine hydrolase domain-containing protein [Naasia sp. SYSU D00057]|uniref:serine hydrolase domain-containing protein n=1 Tax=Naasia sp. SYSU D00057 TaxID=2817380 RepID=UPI0027DBD9D6|nr:serine hydrolase domain-containing protein [Naasia sp. SYSU D00057]
MTPVAGDQHLLSAVRRRLGSRHAVVGAATISADGLAVAVAGADLDADFEIGSISKGITGLLYVDALDRGEVTEETRLGELLPLEGSAAADVTLASLSTHTSGLPGLPPGAEPLRRTIRLLRHGANPYGESREELLAQAAGVRLAAPRPRYSNFGFELLGHAVAAAAGRSYSALLRERIAVPLGLDSMYVPSLRSDLRPTALLGRSRSGRPRDPWTGEGIAPAGGIRSSAGDLGRLAQALLDGSAPGTSALDPVRNFTGPAVRIGAGWLTTQVKGRPIVWHNGGTGGFRSWLGLDREAGTAVVLLTATAESVDRHGLLMLQQLSGR